MKRPLLVWLVFAACAAVGCGVLAWFTREMLRLDHESTEARRLAAVEENVRLALWRMDSALASVHGLEAARPAREYAPFFRADSAYSSSGLAPLPAGSVLLPSPLLGYTPPFVKLQFQIGPDGSIHSPQAPPDDLRQAALAAGIAPERIDGAITLLRDLRANLATTDLAADLPPAPSAPFSAHALADKDQETDRYGSSLFRSDRRSNRADAPAERQTAIREPAAAPPAQIEATPARNEEVKQQLKSAVEQRERAATLDLSNSLNQAVADNRRMQSPVSTNDPSGSGAMATDELAGRRDQGFAGFATASAQSKRQTASTSSAATPAAKGAPRDALAKAEDDAAPEDETPPPPAAAKKTNAIPPDAEGTLQAVWVGHDLLFARRAVIDGKDVVQGAWLDWPELRAWLLTRVSDLLPGARLDPVLPDTAVSSLDAARRLAFLPVQLVPGSVNIDSRALASPLRISIAIAWGGAAIGLAALALLLRGTVRLSERRGAFVSAVTHELRTPLTTFRMYTEMLASGMVQDEAKRRSYVDTLHQESARLSHLVENVLSYARLERGRAAAHVEDTTPAALLARIEERLRQRAQQGGLALRIAFAESTCRYAVAHGYHRG